MPAVAQGQRFAEHVREPDDVLLQLERVHVQRDGSDGAITAALLPRSDPRLPGGHQSQVGQAVGQRAQVVGEGCGAVVAVVDAGSV
jgi:hypothetical protein